MEREGPAFESQTKCIYVYVEQSRSSKNFPCINLSQNYTLCFKAGRIPLIRFFSYLFWYKATWKLVFSGFMCSAFHLVFLLRCKLNWWNHFWVLSKWRLLIQPPGVCLFISDTLSNYSYSSNISLFINHIETSWEKTAENAEVGAFAQYPSQQTIQVFYEGHF